MYVKHKKVEPCISRCTCDREMVRCRRMHEYSSKCDEASEYRRTKRPGFAPFGVKKRERRSFT